MAAVGRLQHVYASIALRSLGRAHRLASKFDVVVSRSPADLNISSNLGENFTIIERMPLSKCGYDNVDVTSPDATKSLPKRI